MYKYLTDWCVHIYTDIYSDLKLQTHAHTVHICMSSNAYNFNNLSKYSKKGFSAVVCSIII